MKNLRPRKSWDLDSGREVVVGGHRESLPDFLWLYLCGSRASSIVKGILRDIYAD